MALNSASLGISEEAMVGAQKTFAEQLLVHFKHSSGLFPLQHSSSFCAAHQSLWLLGILTESIKT